MISIITKLTYDELLIFFQNDLENNETGEEGGEGEEEEEVAQDLDLHQLILSGLSPDHPVKSAEEVIQEIDDIMQVICSILF